MALYSLDDAAFEHILPSHVIITSMSTLAKMYAFFNPFPKDKF